MGMNRVLMVDDEPFVLAALERTLGEDLDLVTATSGRDALALLSTSAEPFAVIVSDMRMPTMSGAELLEKARALTPSTTRVLLTGQTDTPSAAAAVNQGQIFRFLCKPCPHAELRGTIDDAIAHHQLVMAEQVLLEKTLAGTVQVLGDVLGIVAPDIFEQANVVKQYAGHVARTLGAENVWQIEMAAALSNLGQIAMPTNARNDTVTPGGRLQVDRIAAHAEVAHRLLVGIPRLEGVALMIRWQVEPERLVDRPALHLGARILQMALRLEAHTGRGLSVRDAVKKLMETARPEDRFLLEAMAGCRACSETGIVRELSVDQLSPHMVSASDVRSKDGSLLLPAGRQFGAVVLERLRRFARSGQLQEPVRVRTAG